MNSPLSRSDCPPYTNSIILAIYHFQHPFLWNPVVRISHVVIVSDQHTQRIYRISRNQCLLFSFPSVSFKFLVIVFHLQLSPVLRNASHVCISAPRKAPTFVFTCFVLRTGVEETTRSPIRAWLNECLPLLSWRLSDCRAFLSMFALFSMFCTFRQSLQRSSYTIASS